MWRAPQIYATTLTGGDVAALIVNWHEVIHPELTFRFQDLGIVPTPNQRVRVTDLWTYHVVGTYNYD